MTLTTSLQDKIHNEARMRWESEKSPSDPEWWELPTEEVSRRVEAVLADETLSLVELPPPYSDTIKRQLRHASETVAGWPAWKRQGSTACPIPASPPQKDKTG